MSVGLFVGVLVGVDGGVNVGVLVGVEVGVNVGVLVGVDVGVFVGVTEEVLVGVAVIVDVFVDVAPATGLVAPLFQVPQPAVMKMTGLTANNSVKRTFLFTICSAFFVLENMTPLFFSRVRGRPAFPDLLKTTTRNV